MTNYRTKETHGIYYNRLTEQKARDVANRKLAEISTHNDRTYYDRIPWGKIMDAVTDAGFDGALITGVIERDGGRINEFVGGKTYLYVTWYRMPSGRFEVITYVS